MKSFPIGDMVDIQVQANGDKDIAYITTKQDDGTLYILEISTNNSQITITTKATLSLGSDDIKSLFYYDKDSILYIGVNNSIIGYDVSNISTPTQKNSFSFVDTEYVGTPSSIYAKDNRIYLIIQSKGIIILNTNEAKDKLTLAGTVLNIGEDIDNVFSADHRTVNYTSHENNTTRLKIYFFEDTFTDGETDSVYSGASEASEGCFIATASYGSYFEPNVKILRDFRDKYLKTNYIGQIFVDTYYKYSPPIAKAIANNEIAKAIVRAILTPIVYMIKYPILFYFVLFGSFAMWYFRKYYTFRSQIKY
jgi:hypothetical protein